MPGFVPQYGQQNNTSGGQGQPQQQQPQQFMAQQQMQQPMQLSFEQMDNETLL